MLTLYPSHCYHMPMKQEPPTQCWCTVPPTIDSELDRYALHAADGVLHRAGVHVVVRHHHARDGQHLLVVRKQQTRVIGQHLAPLQPGVDGLGAIVMGTMQVKVFAVLQDGRGHHLDVGFGYGD